MEAAHALQKIRTLYAIERRIRDESPDQRFRVRQAESVPMLDALRAWLNDTIARVPASSPLGKAMSYLDNQLPGRCAGATPATTASTPTPSRTPPCVLSRTSELAVRSRKRCPSIRPRAPCVESRAHELDAAAQASLPHRHRTLWRVWRYVARHRVRRDARTHRENPHPSRRPQHRLHRPPPRTAAPSAASPTPGLPISSPVLTAPAGAPQPRYASPPRALWPPPSS